MRILLSVILFSTLACAQAPLSGAPTTPAGAETSAARPSAPGSAAAVPTRPEAPRGDGVSAPLGIDFSKAPGRIAFSCCADQSQAQPVWKTIEQEQPDLFIFMGDTVDATQGSLSEQFKKLDKIPEYKSFRQEIPILAIWDDRDGGADASTRHLARKEFLNYWSYVKTSIPFNQDALYHAKTLGGLVTGKRRKKVNGPSLHVIVLDTRTDRRDGRLLGNEQWDWLEDQLKKPAEFHLLVSSIPVTTSDTTIEKWADFPAEREKLMSLLKRLGPKNLLLLSGSPRGSAINKTELKGAGTFTEFTAGPLTPTKTADGTPVGESYGIMSFDWKKKAVKVELKDAHGKAQQNTDVRMH